MRKIPLPAGVNGLADLRLSAGPALRLAFSRTLLSPVQTIVYSFLPKNTFINEKRLRTGNGTPEQDFTYREALRGTKEGHRGTGIESRRENRRARVVHQRRNRKSC